MRCSNKQAVKQALFVILFSLILFTQISFSAIAKWTKNSSQTYAEPVIDGDSIYLATASGTVYRLSKIGGTVVWTSNINGTVLVSPLIDGNYIYVGSSDGIYILDKSTGKVVSQFITAPQKILTSPLVNGNNLFVAAESKVYIFDLASVSSGRMNPLKTVTLAADTDSSSFVNGNGISLFLTDGRLVFVSPAGGADISFNLGKTIWKAEPLLSNDVIYVGSERTLYALSTGGSIYWSKEFDGWVSPPIMYNNKIYVGSNDGHLYVLNKSGEILGKFRTGDAVLTPAISVNTIYIPSKDNRIYAIDSNTLEPKWNMSLDDWPSTPILSDSVLYTVSLNGTLYAASTLGCEITEPGVSAKVSSTARLFGVAYSDTGLKTVEIKIGEGAWTQAKLSEGKWEINYPISGVSDGAKITAQCRASDTKSTEIEPYNSRSLIFVSSEDKLPRINATYPEKVTSGRDFEITFNDEYGVPLNDVMLTYANKVYNVTNGTIQVTAVDGETALYITKPNYKTQVVTIGVEAPTYMQFIIPIAVVVVVIVIIVMLFSTKKWR
jgi:outer membrane protein assembly factor BamB